jgi:hypothetical protein
VRIRVYPPPLEAELSRAFDVPSSAIGSVLTVIRLCYAQPRSGEAARSLVHLP